MRTMKYICSVFVAALLALSLHSPAVAAPDPVEQIKPVITEITTMLTKADYIGVVIFFSIASETRVRCLHILLVHQYLSSFYYSYKAV